MSVQSRLLLVDDDTESTLSLSRALRASGFKGEIAAAGNEASALALAQAKDFHVAVVDLSLVAHMGVESGFRLIKRLVADHPFTRVVVLTGSASLEHGVKALDMGAAHFIEKPADPNHLLSLVTDSTKQSELRRAFERMRSERGDALEDLVVGSSLQAQRIREDIRFAASNSQTLLITGETGTGKGLCARAVHQVSAQSSGKFVRYQPNFSSADLVNSDLFGHEKGAFTGAQDARRGLVAEANSGTLFLDEIDELPVETQVTLLGVLQEKKFRSLGSNREQDTSIRLICASNQDLETAVASGKLRKDFYHRIAHARIELPPLRERREDIPLLAEKALTALREREQISVFEVSTGATAILEAYTWPGNVRELEASVEGAAYRAQFRRRSIIEPGDIRVTSTTAPDTSVSFSASVESYKLRLIQEALARNAGNQVKAAEELELDRSTMRRILARTI